MFIWEELSILCQTIQTEHLPLGLDLELRKERQSIKLSTEIRDTINIILRENITVWTQKILNMLIKIELIIT